MSLRPRGGFQIDIPDFGIAERIERSGNELAALPKQFARMYAMSQMEAPDVAKNVMVPSSALSDDEIFANWDAIQNQTDSAGYIPEEIIAGQVMVPSPSKQRAMDLLSVADPEMYFGLKKMQAEEASAAAQARRDQMRFDMDVDKFKMDKIAMYGQLEKKFGEMFANVAPENALSLLQSLSNSPEFNWFLNEAGYDYIPDAAEIAADAKLTYAPETLRTMPLKEQISVYQNLPEVKAFAEIRTMAPRYQALWQLGVQNNFRLDPALAEELIKSTYALIEKGVVRDEDRQAITNSGMSNLDAFRAKAKRLSDGNYDLTDPIVQSIFNIGVRAYNNSANELLNIQRRFASAGVTPQQIQEITVGTGSPVLLEESSFVPKTQTVTANRVSGIPVMNTGGRIPFKLPSGEVVFITPEELGDYKKRLR